MTRLTVDQILMPSVVKTIQARNAPPPVLNYLEAGYLRDLAEGKSYSLKYSPHSTRKILRRLIDCKVAYVPYQEVDGVVVDLVCITDYGLAILRG